MKGSELQRIRENLGLARKEFADLCGYDGDAQQLYKTMRRYEDGSRAIPPLLARLAIMLRYAEDYGPGIRWPDDIDEIDIDPRAGAAISKIGGI